MKKLTQVEFKERRDQLAELMGPIVSQLLQPVQWQCVIVMQTINTVPTAASSI